MQELHGLVIPDLNDFSYLKRHALIFDKFYLIDVDYILRDATPLFRHLIIDTEFLLERGLIARIDTDLIRKHYTPPPAQSPEERDRILREYARRVVTATPEETRQMYTERRHSTDGLARRFSASLNKVPGYDTVPICLLDFGVTDTRSQPSDERLHNVLRVGLEALPVPDDSCAWQDILDFRSEMHDKQWGFRRFLHTLATKEQSEAEIRDHIEWTTKEYKEAMKRRRMTIANSAITAFVLPAVDIAVNPASNHMPSIVGCGLAINKLRVELLEGEAKAPGRECAYVFYAWKRFGSQARHTRRSPLDA